MAEERATKRIKNLKEDNLQARKRNTLGRRNKSFGAKREYKLTLSKALDDEALDGKRKKFSISKAS